MYSINGAGGGNILADLGHLLEDVSKTLNNGAGGFGGNAASNASFAEHCHRHHHRHCGNGDQTSPKNGYNASGSITGDPHYDVNGKKFDYQGEAGKTYTELYDPSTGFTDNTTFKAYGNNGANVVGAEGFTFDGNQLEVKAGANGEEVYLNGEKIGNGTYLNGEVTVNNGSVELKADNYDFTVTQRGSGAGAYLDTTFKADNAGNQAQGLGGILGREISDPNASTDAASLSQYEVPGLFNNGSQTGSASNDTGSNPAANLLADLGHLLEDLAAIQTTAGIRTA